MILTREFRDLKPTLEELAMLQGAWREHSRYQGCVGHWLMPEGGGNVAYDYSGLPQLGTMVSLPLWAVGRSGHSIRFDGIDDLLRVEDSPATSPANQLTISMWFRLTAAADDWDCLLMKCSDGAWQDGYGIYFLSGAIRFFITSYNVQFASINFGYTTDTNWHHLLCLYDGANTRIVLDNVEGTPGTYTGAISYVTSLLRIGAGTTGAETHGYWPPSEMDDVRLYDRSVLVDERESLFFDPMLEFREAAERIQYRYFSIPSVISSPYYYRLLA